jgi:hypothetical protein
MSVESMGHGGVWTPFTFTFTGAPSGVLRSNWAHLQIRVNGKRSLKIAVRLASHAVYSGVNASVYAFTQIYRM